MAEDGPTAASGTAMLTKECARFRLREEVIGRGLEARAAVIAERDGVVAAAVGGAVDRGERGGGD